MKVVVLMQDNTPVEVTTIPDTMTRDFQWDQFADKILKRRIVILADAYTKLHPTVQVKHVNSDNLPALGTHILTVQEGKED